jgi:hypothetical protein
MSARTPKRRKVGTKRLDLTDIKHALREGRAWTALGTTYKPDDAEDYWRIVPRSVDEGGGGPATVGPGDDGPPGFDLIVEVELHPSGEIVSARVPAGVWDIPDLGDEVIVAIPDGEIDFHPSIVCRLASGTVPGAQGPAPGRIVIVRNEVFVHGGEGGAVALALKSDVVNVDNKYANHIHLDGSGLPTSGPLATVEPNDPNPASPPPFLDPLGAPTTAPFHEGDALEPAEIVGTTVLKAK